jgi:hypothetical protein
MKTIFYISLIIFILYAIKVPFVVAFVNQQLQIAITVWNYILDVAINLRDRHPIVWISLFGISILCLKNNAKP